MFKSLFHRVAFATSFFVLVHSSSFAADCEGQSGQCDVAAHEAAEAVEPVLKGEIDAYIEGYLLSHPEIIEKIHEKYVREMQERTAAAEKARKDAAGSKS